MSNTTVMRVDMDCYKCKKVALHSVAGIYGIDMISINMREKTLTVVGDADPVCIVSQIRKKFKCAHLLPPPPPPPPPKSGPKPNPEPKPEPEPEPNPEPQPEPKPEPEPAPAPAPPPPSPPPPIIEVHREFICCPRYPHCMVHVSSFAPPQCCGCSGKADMPWPGHHPSMAHADEVVYVWTEENQSWCTIC